ncbi:peptidase MA family metallohydrolase [Xanthomarina sp. GH4-25]|uniref:peptidase MA family metallohydrolase n=1 Tax=Xanthomarina sp. GH4-25 TaxID=3349335 RepID=UPI003877C8F6
MKFKFLILFCIITIIGCRQQSNKSIAPSSWIGKVKMGDTNPELVFNIFKDSLGQLAGNLGIPSKGIQGIPLSQIYIKKDSIVIEISAAQASYRGVFEKNRKTINGIWTEPQYTSPLILAPLTKEIDYDNFKKENTSSLNLESTSDHFNYYSKKEDKKVLDSLSKALESNYLRITTEMQTNFNSKIDVFIYPDLKTFHSAINSTDAPDWVVGAASKNELQMVSPLNPGSEHTYQSLIKAIVHELTHTVVLNIRKQGLVGLPNWLNEGYAYYEAKQLNESQREFIHSQLIDNKIPSWNELEKANNYQFGDLNGYPISATIIEFLVKSYGIDKLKQFIIEPENIKNIYNLSKEDLEVLWLEDLKQKKNTIKN